MIGSLEFLLRVKYILKSQLECVNSLVQIMAALSSLQRFWYMGVKEVITRQMFSYPAWTVTRGKGRDVGWYAASDAQRINVKCSGQLFDPDNSAYSLGFDGVQPYLSRTHSTWIIRIRQGLEWLLLALCVFSLVPCSSKHPCNLFIFACSLSDPDVDIGRPTMMRLGSPRTPSARFFA
jgi:hypothetical protein